MTRPVATVVKAAISILVLLSTLNSQLEFSRQVLAHRADRFEELYLEASTSLRVASLNYSTLAATLGWVALVVNYGVGKRRWASFQHLEHNSQVVNDLDPRFRRLYDWFPGVYLVFRWPQRYEDAEAATRFVSRGFDLFPDGSLPFHAAMSYIGVQSPPEGPTPVYERIIELAELSATQGDPDAAGVLPFYRAKLRGETTVDATAEVAFLTTMLARSTTAADRRRLQAQLDQVARRDDGARALIERSRAFAAEHEAKLPYVSPELFALVGDE